MFIERRFTMRVLKVCASEWINASRDERELHLCEESGAEVCVLAKGSPDDRGRIDHVDGFRVYRYTTRPFSKLPSGVNRIISVLLWARYIRKIKPDIISGHDLVGATIGLLYSIGRKTRLVYDSHEFELGRNVKRSRLRLKMIKLWEDLIIRRSDFTIVVNTSIANELVRIYGLKKPPVVVRNIPDKWDISESGTADMRRRFTNHFGDGSYIVMYHGILSRNRGVEKLIEAVAKLSRDVKLVLLGNADTPEYRKYLCRMVAAKNLTDRVCILDAVPHSELWKYIGASDLCAAPIIPQYKSYYFALPNKLFESIQCGTPIIGSELPEMSRIINGYGVGMTFDPYDPDSIADAIVKMKAKGRDAYSAALEAANCSLNWENEKKQLYKAYKRYL